MRPLRGVVKAAKKNKLIIQIESGLRVEMALRDGLRVGDSCWVTYDFLLGKARYLEKPDAWLPDVTEACDEELFLDYNHEHPSEYQELSASFVHEGVVEMADRLGRDSAGLLQSQELSGQFYE